MDKSHFFHKDFLVEILNSIIGKTLGEVDKNNVFAKTRDKPKITGIAGDVIEQSVLEYPPDQAQRPDLNIDGVETELKTTGIRRKVDKNGNFYYEAKEPASITAVSIDRIVKESFLDSNFWHKIEHILFVFYEYEAKTTVSASEYANFYIRNYCFHEFSTDDIEILKNDWQLVHDFIEDIQNRCTPEEAKKEYPNLSTILNKKTVYIDTAPKYPNHPRFRLRKRVLSVIVEESFNKRKLLEKLPDNYFSQNDIERKCAQLKKLYSGWTVGELLDYFDSSKDKNERKITKQYGERLTVKMFGGKAKKVSEIEIFKKMGYVGKSITITSKGKKTEDMKFIPIDFEELIEKNIDDGINIREKTFEDSDLYNFFHDNKILCIVFEESENGKSLEENRFIGFKILDLSDDEFIKEAKRTWNDCRKIIMTGKLKNIPDFDKNGKQKYTRKTKLPMCAPNLPKSKDHLVFVRGTGKNAKYKSMYQGVEMYKQYFWIQGKFIVKQLENIPFIEDI